MLEQGANLKDLEYPFQTLVNFGRLAKDFVMIRMPMEKDLIVLSEVSPC